MSRVLGFAILSVWLIGFGNAVSASEFMTRISSPADDRWGPIVASKWADVEAFYAERSGRPIWTDKGKLNAAATSALAALKSADYEGLTPSDYLADQQDVAPMASSDPAALERELTGVFLQYVSDLQFGRLLNAGLSASDSERARDSFDPVYALRSVTEATDPNAAIRDLAPANRHYRGLRRARGIYQAVARSGGWPMIESGITIKPGMADPRLPAIRQRLVATGDLAGSSKNELSEAYDDLTRLGIEGIQRRYGLEPDGVIGPKTLAALNVSVEQRLDQISLNMERWRRFELDPDITQIIVNLAGFDLRVLEEGQQVIKMAVAVGRPFRQTPIFSETMTYLEFSPTWTLPPTILREDILPKLRQDATYLTQRGIDVFDGWQTSSRRLDPQSVNWAELGNRALNYRFVQPPGPKNALGTVKFMFPNEHSIYLHDTPDRSIFGRAARAFSSGCIRIADPMGLARYLLADQPAWDEERITSAMSQSAPVRVNLSRRPVVRLTYSTVWEEDGELQFREDIYGRDEQLWRALAAQP